MFGTTCKLYNKLISIDICRRICKIPILPATGDSQGHLDITKGSIQSFIETHKENSFLGCRESSTNLVTAIMSLDRVVALFGGYHSEIVGRLLTEKKAANDFYLKASSTDDFAKAEELYAQIYHSIYKDFGVLIRNMPCKANLKSDELHCLSVPPVCKGTMEVQRLLCQVLSNAGQCCIKQRNRTNHARKFLRDAISYVSNHTKSLFRLGMVEIQDVNYQKAKKWLLMAKQSTMSSQERKSIDKYLEKVKLLQKEHVAASAKKYAAMIGEFSNQLDINNEHTLLDRDAIWTFSDKQRAEYTNDDEGCNVTTKVDATN